MGVSWKMRFLVVQAFQRELLARNEARNPPHPAHYVLDRLSEFIDAVRHGNFDQILIYQKAGSVGYSGAKTPGSALLGSVCGNQPITLPPSPPFFS